MAELMKPPGLAARGGCWFRSGGWEVHLGVETGLQPFLDRCNQTGSPQLQPLVLPHPSQT